jgi:predicted RNA-binding protein with EMAP domain
MDPKKLFLANMIEGALEAEVITLDDLYRHVSAEILAQYVPPELVSACIQEGMERSGLAKKL